MGPSQPRALPRPVRLGDSEGGVQEVGRAPLSLPSAQSKGEQSPELIVAWAMTLGRNGI